MQFRFYQIIMQKILVCLFVLTATAGFSFLPISAQAGESNAEITSDSSGQGYNGSDYFNDYGGNYSSFGSSSVFATQSSNCGLSLTANTTRITEDDTRYQLGVQWNQQRCQNPIRLEEIRVRGQQNVACISGRTQALLAGKNPNEVCTLINN
jgi:hypothetical protein